ncbi:hypothetical protein F511_45367 [Dorcoceras hygrometricum]|uniref:Uncharacterized protein n=1 Tax=Dorcoceras hygrometricum TaxID=472368 RepID=A0A2Z6ZXD0_9LAMI|nr:hypothetical protein F511_45367 [Dorcoceras hygrometricum]
MKSQRWISSFGPGPVGTPPPPFLSHAAAARCRRKFVSGQLDEENPFVLISSALLVQPDEGVSDLVVDRIGVNYRNLPRRDGFLIETSKLRRTATGRRRVRRPPRSRSTRMRERNHARWSRMARGRRRKRHVRGAHRCAWAAESRRPPFLHYVAQAPLLGVLLRDVAPLVALDGRVSTPRDGAAGRCNVGTPLREVGDRRIHGGAALRCASRDGARAAAAFFVVAAPPSPAAAPPSLRRVSDDVVTAGLISSRV